MKKEILSYPWTFIACLTAGLLYGTPISQFWTKELQGPWSGSTGWVGLITSEPVPGQSGLLCFSMDLSQINFPTGTVETSGRIKVRGWGGCSPVLGQIWTVKGTLFSQGNEVSGRIKELTYCHWADEPAFWRYTLRKCFFDAVDRLPKGPGALGKALVMGAVEDLSPGEKNAFRDSGTSHVLALSGMHLSLFAVILNFILKPLVGRRTSLGITGVFQIFFVWLAGPIPSLVRSLLMYFILSAQLLLGIKKTFIEILSQSFLAVALLWPEGLFNLSMELSFLALAGIGIFGPQLEVLWRRTLTPLGAPALATGFGAALGTLPLTGLLFGVFQPEGLLFSIPLGFLTTILIYFTLFYGVIIGILPWVALDFLHPLFQGLYDMILAIVYFGAWIPGVAGPGILAVLSGEGLFLLWFFFYKRKYDFKLRLPWRNQKSSRTARIQSIEKVGPEFLN